MGKGKNRRNKRILAALLIICGLGFISIALVADYFGTGGHTGIGPNQIKLLLVGIAILASGFFLLTSVGERVILKISGLAAQEGKPLEAYQHLVIALWFGYLTGMIEASVYAVRQNILQQFINLGSDVYWMTILANLIIFAILGFLLFLIASLAPEYVPLPLTVFSSAFAAIMILMLLFERINQIASLLLAIGAAIQIVRIIVKRSDRFYAFITRSFVWVIPLGALLVISMEVLP